MTERKGQIRQQGPETQQVLAVGSLACPARTITGVHTQAEWFGVAQKKLGAILRRIGLPERALDEPTFLISIDQELALIEILLDEAGINGSLAGFVFGQPDLKDVTLFGNPGLAMRHAPNLLAALKVGFDYPQLFWGHSRMRVAADDQALTITFLFDRRATDNEALAEYSLLLDLVSYHTFVNQIMGPSVQVAAVHLPFAVPADKAEIERIANCPVHFDMETAALILPPDCADAAPVQARPLTYKQNIAVCAELARLRPIESALSDQALRWLWAYAPPLPRADLAKRLGMSERSLARRLRHEGTSYQRLFAQVQSERARNLLRIAALSIGEVGYRLGYTDPAAFTRAFMGWMGETPSAWRLRHK